MSKRKLTRPQLETRVRSGLILKFISVNNGVTFSQILECLPEGEDTEVEDVVTDSLLVFGERGWISENNGKFAFTEKGLEILPGLGRKLAELMKELGSFAMDDSSVGEQGRTLH